MKEKNEKLVLIKLVPFYERFKIYLLSVIFGLLAITKMFLKRIWDSKSFLLLKERDNPPPFMVDSSFGMHKYVKLKGVKLHYVESGTQNQPLILLLHGFPDCWLSWRHQIPVLSKHFRVIALDLKGFGDSDKPFGRNNYRIDLIIEELKQLIGILGVTSCTIIGHDIGGLLAWYLAEENPELIDKLIVISAPHPNIYRKTLNNSTSYKWLYFVQLPYFPEIDALKEDVKIVSDYHKHLVQKQATHLEAYKYSFSRKEDWTGALNYFRNLLFTEIREEAELIDVPVLLITGNMDSVIKLENVVKSTDYCEKSKVKVIEAEHFPHQENPTTVNNAILKFLVKRKMDEKPLQRQQSQGIMNRMFGAVSSTVKYGNSVIDNVQKRTNEVVGGLPNLLIYNSSSLVNTDKG